MKHSVHEEDGNINDGQIEDANIEDGSGVNDAGLNGAVVNGAVVNGNIAGEASRVLSECSQRAGAPQRSIILAGLGGLIFNKSLAYNNLCDMAVLAHCLQLESYWVLPRRCG